MPGIPTSSDSYRMPYKSTLTLTAPHLALLPTLRISPSTRASESYMIHRGVFIIGLPTDPWLEIPPVPPQRPAPDAVAPPRFGRRTSMLHERLRTIGQYPCARLRISSVLKRHLSWTRQLRRVAINLEFLYRAVHREILDLLRCTLLLAPTLRRPYLSDTSIRQGTLDSYCDTKTPIARRL